MANVGVFDPTRFYYVAQSTGTGNPVYIQDGYVYSQTGTFLQFLAQRVPPSLSAYGYKVTGVGPSYQGGIRTALIGDSLLALGLQWSSGQGMPVTSYVVSGGIATLTISSTCYIWPGNYFMLVNQSDTLAVHPDNCTNPIALTANGTTAITFKSQAADGTYTNYASGTWYVQPITTTSDSSWFAWMNNFMNGQFLITHSFAATGTVSTLWASAIGKIMATANDFDVAAISLGHNDINAASTNQATAVGVAANVFANITTIVSALRSAGKLVMLTVPTPFGTTGGNFTGAQCKYLNYAVNQLRMGFIGMARGDAGIFLVDMFEANINGTTANSDFVTGYTADGIHALCTSLIPFGRYLATNVRQWLAGARPFYHGAVCAPDDPYGNSYMGSPGPYLNAQSNSAFLGSGGSTTGTNVSGTVATSWNLIANSGTPMTVVGSVVAPTVPTGNAIDTYSWANLRNTQHIVASAGAANDQCRLESTANNFTPWVSGWYQMRASVVATAAPTAINQMFLQLKLTGAVFAFANNAGNLNSGAAWVINSGDYLTLTSGAIYVPSTFPTQNYFDFYLQASGAPTWAFDLLSPELRLIPNPYTIPI